MLDLVFCLIPHGNLKCKEWNRKLRIKHEESKWKFWHINDQNENNCKLEKAKNAFYSK